MIRTLYANYDTIHDNSFVYDYKEGHDFWLLVATKTPAIFQVAGVKKEYPAFSAILYQPHQPIYYQASQHEYINDWIRFETDEPFITNTKLPLGMPFSLADPIYCHMLFQLISNETYLKNEFRNSSLDGLFRTLFNKLSESFLHEIPIKPPHYYELIELRTALCNTPTKPWTIHDMALSLHLSTGYLQSIYKKYFGHSCMEEVINSRIRLAKDYLSHGNHTISEVAYLCGYNNVEHFCRQFRKITGSTPSEYMGK